MKISDCPSRVAVAQRSEHRYIDSETLGSIPGWGSQIFRIYIYISYEFLVVGTNFVSCRCSNEVFCIYIIFILIKLCTLVGNCLIKDLLFTIITIHYQLIHDEMK